MQQIIKLCFFLLALWLSSSIFATNLHFLKDSAVSYFSEQDLNLMEAYVYKALDNKADGEKIDWQSADGKIKGRVIIEKTYANPGQQANLKLFCRQARIVNFAKNQNGNSSYKFCKNKDNKWKLVK